MNSFISPSDWFPPPHNYWLVSSVVNTNHHWLWVECVHLLTSGSWPGYNVPGDSSSALQSECGHWARNMWYKILTWVHQSRWQCPRSLCLCWESSDLLAWSGWSSLSATTSSSGWWSSRWDTAADAADTTLYCSSNHDQILFKDFWNDWVDLSWYCTAWSDVVR